jgi:hypothetical protein
MQSQLYDGRGGDKAAEVDEIIGDDTKVDSASHAISPR